MATFNILTVDSAGRFEVVEAIEGDDIQAAIMDHFPPEFFMVAEIQEPIYGFYDRPSITHVIIHPEHLSSCMAGGNPWTVAYVEEV